MRGQGRLVRYKYWFNAECVFDLMAHLRNIRITARGVWHDIERLDKHALLGALNNKVRGGAFTIFRLPADSIQLDCFSYFEGFLLLTPLGWARHPIAGCQRHQLESSNRMIPIRFRTGIEGPPQLSSSRWVVVVPHHSYCTGGLT